MAPLVILACILLGVLGSLWLLFGMPAVAPMLILLAACFLGGLYFLFGMPAIIAILVHEYRRTRKLTTNLLASLFMLCAFYISAILTWFLTTSDWNLSFPTTLKAAGNAAKYGHSIEHASQGLLSVLLIISTLSAVAAGIVTIAARYALYRYRRLRA
jgi:hypothetical protein